MTNKTTHQTKAPKLRFKDFNWDWEEKEFWNFANKEKWKYNPKISSENYSCIELECIEQNTWIILNTFDSINQESIKNTFKKWNVLYSKLRPYLNKYYYAKFDWVCSSEIWVLNWIKTDSKFLYYIIQTWKFSKVANMSFGSKMPRSDWDFVSWTPFWVPSLPEQQKIADFLSSVDEKIEKIKEKKKLLEEYKKWVMQKIFSQEIRFKDENWEEFGDWEEKKLWEVFENIWWTALEEYTNENWEYNFISIWNYTIDWKYIDNKQRIILNEKTKTKLLEKNNLVMVLNDKTSTWDMIWASILIDEDNKYIYNQRSERLICKSKINSLFAWFLLNSKDFRKRIVSVSQWWTQIYVNFGEIKKLEINLPFITEQEKIADFLSGIDEKIEKISLELESVEKFKKGLLQSMFV